MQPRFQAFSPPRKGRGKSPGNEVPTEKTKVLNVPWVRPEDCKSTYSNKADSNDCHNFLARNKTIELLVQPFVLRCYGTRWRRVILGMSAAGPLTPIWNALSANPRRPDGKPLFVAEQKTEENVATATTIEVPRASQRLTYDGFPWWFADVN